MKTSTNFVRAISFTIFCLLFRMWWCVCVCSVAMAVTAIGQLVSNKSHGTHLYLFIYFSFCCSLHCHSFILAVWMCRHSRHVSPPFSHFRPPFLQNCLLSSVPCPCSIFIKAQVLWHTHTHTRAIDKNTHSACKMRWCRRHSESTPVTVKDYLRYVWSVVLSHTLLQSQCHWLKITFRHGTRTHLLLTCVYVRTSYINGMAWHGMPWYAMVWYGLPPFNEHLTYRERETEKKKAIYFRRTLKTLFVLWKGHTHASHIYKPEAHTANTIVSIYMRRVFYMALCKLQQSNTWFVRISCSFRLRFGKNYPNPWLPSSDSKW